MNRILLLATLLLVAAISRAASVDVATAQLTAQRFYQNMTGGTGLKAGNNTGNARLIHCEYNPAHPNQATYYIFNTDDHFIIVAGDDRAHEVLVWGDAPLDMHNIPDAMKYWLGCYQQDLIYLQDHPGLVVETGPRRAPSHNTPSVAPLLNTMWDQSYPYFNQCPVSDGSHCLTGCAATSLSMVCHYWRYPKEISTIPAYTTSSLHMSLNALPPTTFDYDNMLDMYIGSYYNEVQAQAVAHLMRYVGQAEHMDYTPSASGVSSWDINRAVSTLGFDSDATMVFKDNYSNDEWAAMLQEELAAGHPLEYCGFSNTSGHAFNVDGYDAVTDMYHINWGWSGSGNCYCALNAFRGGGSNYKSGQLTFIGLVPPITVPTIQVRGTHLHIDAMTETNSTASFTVKGRLLTDDVTLKLNDPNGVFSLSRSSLAVNELSHERSIVVTYSPSIPGTHEATITLSSNGAPNVNVNITGTAVLETYDPMIVQATHGSNNDINVQWQDGTPSKNVKSYRLEIAPTPYHEMRIEESFSSSYEGSSTTDWSAALDEFTSIPGWTGYKVYRSDGHITLGSASKKGWIKTPDLDMRHNDGLVTVKVTGKSTGQDQGCPVRITCADSAATVILTNEVSQQSVMLPCAPSDTAHIIIGNSITGKRCQIMSIMVLAGDDITPADLTRASYYEDITSPYFQISNIAPGSYSLRVQALYIDGTLSQWSVPEVVNIGWINGDVNRDNEVNIADVNAVVDIILSSSVNAMAGDSDVNGDGEVNLADVNAIIDKIIGNE